jgi:hypothetical protein
LRIDGTDKQDDEFSLGAILRILILNALKKCFGETMSTPFPVMKKDVPFNGKLRRRFQVSMQRFEKLDDLAMPHPKGAWPAYEYIGAFRPGIEPPIKEYRSSAGI